MQLRLGGITLDTPFYLAPLSGYSDRAMRAVSRRYGAVLTFTPVMLDNAALHRKALSKSNFAISDDEHPIGAQLLGSDPGTMARAAKVLEARGHDLIDLNFACPAPKVLRRGRGGALLAQPSEAIAIYRAVRDAVTCPVVLKLRIAYEDPAADLDAFWHICEHAVADGINGLVVHGRSVQQRFRGKADWHILSQLKYRFGQTTIIGSGDIFTAETALERLRSTGIDAVAIACGAIGNPWIFNDIRCLLKGETATQPDMMEQGSVMLDHWRMVLEMYPPKKAVGYFRKFVARYCKRHPRRKAVQLELLGTSCPDEVTAAIKHWYFGYSEKGMCDDKRTDRAEQELPTL